MRKILQSFHVQFQYGVYFTKGIFDPANPLLRELLRPGKETAKTKVLFVVDQGVAEAHPALLSSIEAYTAHPASGLLPVTEPLVLPGGEEAKNNPRLLEQLLQAVHEHGICRHSFLIAIGGGAVLDLAGFAAAVAHRGIRHIRVPTTVLSQNDSGVGVKNGVNAFGKKNFLGTFAPPLAVINDSDFLLTLEDRDWRSGISEALKVALIKDAAFFRRIEQDARLLVNRDLTAMQELIFRCAQLHVQHIGGKDPFEKGNSRPLDFGHWAAHKLEQLSSFRLRHGEAVAIGIALDTAYSWLAGLLSEKECAEVLELLSALGFELYVPELSLETGDSEHPLQVLKGLTEFREHLGGQLTVMLLSQIGTGVEVHHLEESLVAEAVRFLHKWQTQKLYLSEKADETCLLG
jgi:3-dehydroquinate synthase